MLTGYFSTILEAVENVFVEPSKRLIPEIQILGDIRIELLVKEGEQISLLKKSKEEKRSENRALKDWQKGAKVYYYKTQ